MRSDQPQPQVEAFHGAERTSWRLAVQVQPNASRNEVVAFEDGVLRVKIAAPPVKGRANRELIHFLSQRLGVSRGSITIEKGLTSRRKVIAIAGLSQDEVTQRLKREIEK